MRFCLSVYFDKILNVSQMKIDFWVNINLLKMKKGRIATFNLLIVCVTPILVKVQELLMQLTRAGRLKLLNSYQTRK